MTWRVSFAVAMGLPSSETATMPASFIAAISAIASPLLPTLAAPIGHTRTLAEVLTRSRMKRVTLALSLTGLVLGMQQTAVKPPRAAERVPVSIVSEDSCPGSRRWAWRSMKPGATMRPLASNTSTPSFGPICPGDATSAILSPSRRMSRGASVLEAGSRTRPFLTRSMRGILFERRGGMLSDPGFRAADQKQEQQGHANGNAVGDLFEDAGLRAVGDFGGDLNSAIHRSGVENDGVGLGEAETCGVELVEQNVIAGGKRGLVQAFGLHAQDNDDVGAGERFFDAENAAHRSAGRADLFELAREPHRRTAKREAAAEFSQQMNVRTGHAAVRNVAEDGDIEVFDGAFAVTNGERVEEALRGMLVHAVAGVDDGNLEMAGDEIRGAGRRVAHDQAVRLHGVQRMNGIQEGLAFFQARGFRLQIQCIGAEARSCGAEADARARGIFKESQGDGFTAQGGEFLKRIPLNSLKILALVEKKTKLVRVERFERQHVAEAVVHIYTLWPVRKKNWCNL